MGMRKPSEVQSFTGSVAIEMTDMVLEAAGLRVDSLSELDWSRTYR